jgi:tetratricopeptide (TPR) repeat protein
MRTAPLTLALALALTGTLFTAAAAPKKGDRLPPFNLLATDGASVSSSVFNQADIGVLYFFSVQQCPACINGLKQLEQLASQHDDKGLRIVALGKQDLASLKKFFPTIKVDILAADGNTLSEYNAQHILPTTYITGPGGVITGILQGGGASTEAMLVRLAERQIQRQKPAQAQALFESAEKSGGGSLAKAGTGYSLLKGGKVKEAEALFSDMANSKDKETSIRGKEGLAEVALARNEPAAALHLADDVLKMSPKRVNANLIKSRALNQTEGASKAEPALTEATRDDADADFSFQKADAHLAKGNLLSRKAPEIALASFRTAASENPHSVEAISNLGAIQNALGNPRQAAESLKKALELAPGDKLLHGMMRQVQESMAQQQDLEYQRHIDAAVKELVARFKEQAAQPKAARDDWTSPPTVVSILGFRDETAPGMSGRLGLEGALQHELQRALMALGVQVVDRALMDKLLAELRLGSSELADPETQLKLGRIMAARLIATGTVRRDKSAQASMRLVDTETTGIAMATSDRLPNAPDPMQIAQKQAEEIASMIKAKYPVKGRIALVENESVIINVGKKHGVQTGQLFNVLGTPEPIELNGKVLGHREKKLGELQITEVQDGLAYGKAKGPAFSPEKNQRIVLKDEQK